MEQTSEQALKESSKESSSEQSLEPSSEHRTPPAVEERANHAPLTNGLIRLMAFACGMSVANMYYCQPLLAQMQHDFHVTTPQVSTIPVLTQAGCALGMLLFVPMGDIWERKRLILQLLMLATAALGVASVAPGLGWMVAASLVIGLANVVPHLILPFAAQLARPEERGRAVGSVLGGLLIGILLARTVSGHIGDQFGWRAMYGLASALMIGLALILWRALPRSLPSAQLTYPQMLISLLTLIREQPVLREAALLGALMFGAFSVFWNSLVFLLEGAPYHYAHAGEGAGLFGLVGVVGAAAAPIMGRIADQRSPRLTLAIALWLTLASYGVFWLFGFQLWGLIAGVIVMDFGVQSAHVSNQTRIYALLPAARSRLNTVYMVSYFVGGVIGTSLGAQAWNRFHWHGVCAVGLFLLVLSLIVFRIGSKKKMTFHHIYCVITELSRLARYIDECSRRADSHAHYRPNRFPMSCER